jgi:hypothetical protein
MCPLNKAIIKETSGLTMPYPHQFIKLTPGERKKIDRASKIFALQGKWKKRRYLSILYLSDAGRPFRVIASYCRFSYATVRRWIYRYRKEGLAPFLKGLKMP